MQDGEIYMMIYKIASSFLLAMTEEKSSKQLPSYCL